MQHLWVLLLLAALLLLETSDAKRKSSSSRSSGRGSASKPASLKTAKNTKLRNNEAVQKAANAFKSGLNNKDSNRKAALPTNLNQPNANNLNQPQLSKHSYKRPSSSNSELNYAQRAPSQQNYPQQPQGSPPQIANYGNPPPYNPYQPQPQGSLPQNGMQYPNYPMMQPMGYPMPMQQPTQQAGEKSSFLSKLIPRPVVDLTPLLILPAIKKVGEVFGGRKNHHPRTGNGGNATFDGGNSSVSNFDQVNGTNSTQDMDFSYGPQPYHQSPFYYPPFMNNSAFPQPPFFPPFMNNNSDYPRPPFFPPFMNNNSDFPQPPFFPPFMNNNSDYPRPPFFPPLMNNNSAYPQPHIYPGMLRPYLPVDPQNQSIPFPMPFPNYAKPHFHQYNLTKGENDGQAGGAVVTVEENENEIGRNSSVTGEDNSAANPAVDDEVLVDPEEKQVQVETSSENVAKDNNVPATGVVYAVKE